MAETRECPAHIMIDGPQIGGNGGVLACWLGSGHVGPHFDEADQVYWYTAKEADHRG